MSAIAKLVELMRLNGLDVTPDQARQIAIRISGSVEAYLSESLAAQTLADNFQPNTGACSDKFTEDLSFTLESRPHPEPPDRDS